MHYLPTERYERRKLWNLKFALRRVINGEGRFSLITRDCRFAPRETVQKNNVHCYNRHSEKGKSDLVVNK